MQAPWAWYSRIDEFLLYLRFTKTVVDKYISYMYVKTELEVLVLYMEDLIIKSSSEKLIMWYKVKMSTEFDM